ncbi:uncharacterized protein LOC111258459 [Setaria italica]|uniref:uncharacterized protein LOC111258459 n=1 Tax=Setaria italica TaxID=4555 RepID=UPI000BE4F542|nr:uncharacterized protein LOC111258459 [Setaria italica]
MVLQSLKSRIFDDASKYTTKWLRELPYVIWGLRTQKSPATGYTPFFLVYGSGAVLRIDVAFGAPQIQYYKEREAKKSRQVDIDSREEHPVAALIQHVQHELQIQRYHDRNVLECSFNFGNLMLRWIQSTKDMHKLLVPREESFIVKEVIQPGTYRLQSADGSGIPNPWNIQHLRRLYP